MTVQRGAARRHPLHPASAPRLPPQPPHQSAPQIGVQGFPWGANTMALTRFTHAASRRRYAHCTTAASNGELNSRLNRPMKFDKNRWAGSFIGYNHDTEHALAISSTGGSSRARHLPHSTRPLVSLISHPFRDRLG